MIAFVVMEGKSCHKALGAELVSFMIESKYLCQYWDNIVLDAIQLESHSDGLGR